MELDHSGFNSQGVTVHACNIGNNNYVLQVSDMGLFLLQGGKPAHSATRVMLVWLANETPIKETIFALCKMFFAVLCQGSGQWGLGNLVRSFKGFESDVPL